MNKKEIGLQRAKDILGSKVDNIISSFAKTSPDFAKYVVEYGYADLYTREGFSDKNRELAVVACLIGQGNTGLPLKAHMNGMLNVGWSKDEIVETLILLTGFAGFPSCVDALLTLQTVLDERSAST